MPYFLYDGAKPVGPFDPAELIKRPGFTAATLVIPAGKTSATDWAQAGTFPDIYAALVGEPAPAPKTEITLSMPPPAAPRDLPGVRQEKTLDLPPEAAKAPAAAPADDFAPASTKQILVVDDEPAIRDFIEMICQGEGFKVTTAVDGNDALAKLAKADPSLIITDLMMPGLGGFELLRAIQASEGRVPIFVVSASKLDDSTIKMIRSEANVVDFIPKPVPVAVLTSAVHKTLKTRKG